MGTDQDSQEFNKRKSIVSESLHEDQSITSEKAKSTKSQKKKDQKSKFRPKFKNSERNKANVKNIEVQEVAKKDSNQKKPNDEENNFLPMMIRFEPD